MAAFIPCPGIAEFGLQTANPAGDIAINKVYVYQSVASPWTLASLENMNDTLDTWLTTGGGAGQKFIDQISSAAIVQSISARDLTTETALVAVKQVSHAGTDTSTPLPAGISKAITLRTGRAGRSFRGRLFCPCPTEAWQDASDKDEMDATKLTNMVAMWRSLLTAIPAGDASWVWGVLSRYSGVDPTTKKPIPRATGILTPITEVGYSHTALDYQKRRAPFHARHA